MSEKLLTNALRADYTLYWYRIERVLGHGAFGITYLAHDVNLDRRVAIKEYMPNQLCARSEDLSIQPLSEEQEEDYKWGLSRFITEARTLTQFEHPNLVRVYSVFELNNTAYMVMNYEVGRSLQQMLKGKKTLPEKELIKILLPLMDGLELIHAKGFIHRDIKPGNVFIRDDGSPVLLDFGSARQTRGRDEPQTLTSFVSPGYAPIEQYTSKSDRQGPWTDIYGMGATLYRAITGISPASAIDRSDMISNGTDEHKSLAELMKGRYSDSFLAAIDHAMVFNAQDRPQTIAEWRAEFDINEEDVDTMPAFNVHEYTIEATQKLEQPTEPTLNIAEPKTLETVQRVDPEAVTINAAEADGTLQTLTATTRHYLGGNKFVITGMAAVIATVITVVLITQKLIRETTEQGTAVTAVDTPSETGKPEAKTATETPTNKNAVTDKVEVSAPTGSQQDRIKELLQQAETDMRALRLMTPKGNNAYERYQEVLALDKDNQAALEGFEAISDTYVQLAYGAMDSGKYSTARVYLRRAQRLSPESPTIDRANRVLEEKIKQTASTEPIQEGKENGNIMNNIKNWFRSDKESKEPPSKESTSSDRVRKALGGN